jgi:hypothetical protein
MKTKIICMLLLISMISCALVSCIDKNNVASTIEISEDGYWVINGEKSDVKAKAEVASIEEKEFVVGEEILFVNGEEFPISSYEVKYFRDDETFEITESETIIDYRITAKMVAVEEFKLDDQSNWPYKGRYLFSYKYRLFVTGYCSPERAGEKFNYTLQFRTAPYNGVDYMPTANYESSTIGEDGYFEFSVDVYMPDMVTEVIPTRLSTSYELTK